MAAPRLAQPRQSLTRSRQDAKPSSRLCELPSSAGPSEGALVQIGLRSLGEAGAASREPPALARKSPRPSSSAESFELSHAHRARSCRRTFLSRGAESCAPSGTAQAESHAKPQRREAIPPTSRASRLRVTLDWPRHAYPRSSSCGDPIFPDSVHDPFGSPRRPSAPHRRADPCRALPRATQNA